MLEAEPGAAIAWQLEVRSQGVLARALGRGLAVSPPLVTTEEEVTLIGEAMRRGLSALERRLTTGSHA